MLFDKMPVRDLVSHSYPSNHRWNLEMEVLTLTLADGRWTYRGEGNANLVIALLQERVIVRFYKWEKGARVSTDEGLVKVQRDVHFCRSVVSYYLSKDYVEPPLLASIRPETVAHIDRVLLPLRPTHRQHKGIRFGWVTISPDYAFLPPILTTSENFVLWKNAKLWSSRCSGVTYCVEIKPKQGWLHPKDRHHPKCTFCLNQFLKVEKGSVGRVSLYCPLDLFSGIESRMKKALSCLLKTPQNNLKIFEDGKLVFADERGSYVDVLRNWMEPNTTSGKTNNKRLVDKWCSLIQEALMRELTDEPLPECFLEDDTFCYYPKDDFCDSPLSSLVSPCDWSSSPFPPNCILSRLLKMQTLQQNCFKTLFELYKLMRKTETDYCYVDRLTNKKSLNDVERYLLAATAKDCSILISFQRTDSSPYDIDAGHYIKDSDGVPYMMNIGVSDLDPKPLSCIGKHYKRDKDMVAACLKIASANNRIYYNSTSNFQEC